MKRLVSTSQLAGYMEARAVIYLAKHGKCGVKPLVQMISKSPTYLKIAQERYGGSIFWTHNSWTLRMTNRQRLWELFTDIEPFMIDQGKIYRSKKLKEWIGRSLAGWEKKRPKEFWEYTWELFAELKKKS